MIYRIILIVMFIQVSIADYKKNAVEQLKEFEGFSSTFYKDGNTRSIGYGLTLDKARDYGLDKCSVINKSVATSLLIKKVNRIDSILEKYSWYSSLLPISKTGLICCYYNCPAILGPRFHAYMNNDDIYNASLEIAYGNRGQNRVRRFYEANQLLKSHNINGFLPMPHSHAVFVKIKRNINR